VVIDDVKTQLYVAPDSVVTAAVYFKPSPPAPRVAVARLR
jgi:hypothetical protein